MNTIITPNARTVAARMVWLAFQASSAQGMGFIHAGTAANAIEDDVLSCALGQTYPDGSVCINADYVFGRMMKLYFWFNEGHITLNPRPLDVEYQSWCRTYPTFEDLRIAAIDSLKLP